MTSCRAILVRAALILSGISMAGCASTLGGSHPTNAASTKPVHGVPYRLPRVTMAVALIRNADGVAVVFTPPIYGPDNDPTSAYLLQYYRRSTAKDTLTISVDPNTSLLTSVVGEADDQGAKIVEELGKLAGAFAKPESSIEAGEPQLLYEATFDPGDAADVAAVTNGLNVALGQPLQQALDRDCDFSVERALLSANPKSDKRASMESELRASTPVCRIASRARAKSFVIPRLWLNIDYSPFKYGSQATPASCEVGICTRVLSPARMAVGVGEACSPAISATTPDDKKPPSKGAPASAGVTDCASGQFALRSTNLATRSFLMPNNSDPVPIALGRAAFAKVNYDIKLQNGLVSTSNVIKESEALAIVAAPGKAIDAFFKSLANIVQLKIDLTKKEKELLDAKKDTLDSREALQDAEDAAAKKKKEEKEAKAESAAELAATTPYLLVEIPGLGVGSGAELVFKGTAKGPAPAIGDITRGGTKDSSAANAAGSTKTPKDEKPKTPEEELGGEVSRGSNDSEG